MDTAFAFLGRHRRLLIVLALLVVIAAQAVGFLWARETWQRDRAELSADLGKEIAAHQETVSKYEIAVAVAARRELETAARVSAEQRAITERITDAFEARLADGDARYQRLREQAAAYFGRVVDPDLSAAREATCQAYAATACDQLPALLKAAQDNTDQLVALIDWAVAQGEVDVNRGAAE